MAQRNRTNTTDRKGAFGLRRRELVIAFLASAVIPGTRSLAGPSAKGQAEHAGAFAEMERLAASDARGATVSLAPGEGWNGRMGSGFQRPPQDPVRTTAKPAIRLLVPPGQAYTYRIVVGVAAGANDRGDYLTNLGLAGVEVHFEGRTARIEQPTTWRYRDSNGVVRSVFGWWAELVHDGRNRVETDEGGAEVYFTAIPRDPSMQSRVIGPYCFHPRNAMHDAELTVAPTKPVVPGSRYKTLKDATDYIRESGKNFARITITESGLYDWQPMQEGYHSTGYTVVEASVPVTIGKAARPVGQNYDSASVLRPKLEPLCLRGRNLTLDFRNVFQFYHERPTNRQHWLDGCVMTNSDPAGRGALWRKGLKQISQVIRDWPYFTEVSVSHLLNAMFKSSLARSCSLRAGAWDIFTESLCVFGNRVHDWDTSSDWNIYKPAISVTHRGSGVATLECSGFNLARKRVFAAKVDGQTIGTLSVGSGDDTYLDPSHYNFTGVVAWLNSLPDWHAQLIDDSRLAAANQIDKTIGPWGPVPVAETPLTIYSYFDVHPDFYQKNDTGFAKENVIIMDNVATDIVMQDIFLKGKGGCVDFFAVNNQFANKDKGAKSDRRWQFFSQLTNQQQHVVVAANTFAGQNILIRTDMAGTELDGYCLIADNSVQDISWRGPRAGNPTVRRNFPPQPPG